MSKLTLIYSGIVIPLFFFFGCKKTEIVDPPPSGKYSKGIFIVNEGPFQTGTGTIDFIDRETDSIEYNIFQNVNGRPLGNIVQSYNVYNGNGYIVVNNANKLEVIDPSTFESKALIEQIILPRYFLGIDHGKGYVTSWADVVAVIDLAGLSLVKTITVGTGPEIMLRTGNKVFVLNQGGYGTDSTVTVIDTEYDAVVTTLPVYPKPTGIQEDKNGKIWIICSGKGWNGWPQPGDSEGHLLRINPSDFITELDISFPSIDAHPEKLLINNAQDILFFNMPDGIHQFSITETDITGAILKIPSAAMFYQIGYDPETNMLYGSDPLDYAQNGWIHRFDATSETRIDSLRAGVIPGGFYFK